jgi:hypothetical protein
MIFKQVAFLGVISRAGLDIPHNLRACLHNIEEASNLLVPETIKLLVDQLSIS